MKINDNFIELEEGEYNKLFGYIDKKIIYPENLQKNILEEFLYQISLNECNVVQNIESMFDKIPSKIIGETVEKIDGLYNDSGKVNYNQIYLQYLIYYLPVNTFKIHRLLGDLVLSGVLKTKIRILDIGTGPGSIPIGIIEFYKILSNNRRNIDFKIEISILDEENNFLVIAKNLLKRVTKELPPNLYVTINNVIHKKIDKKFNLKREYDLICMSNLLNKFELDEEFDIDNYFTSLCKSLDNKGSILIIEPGDNDDCTNFKNIRNSVLKNTNLDMFSPCNNVWGDKGEYKCCCFTSGKVLWEKPVIIKLLNDRGLLKSPDDIPFNYVIFRKDGKTKYEKIRYKNDFTKIKNINKKNNEIISVIGVVRCLMESSNYLMVSICDGTKEMSKDEHVSITLNKKNSELFNQYYELLKHMNLGQKIIAKKLCCNKMWKYPKSYMLNISENSELEFYF